MTAPNNLRQAVVNTLSEPDGSYRLPDGNRIVPAVSPGGRPVWLVTFYRDGIAWWLSKDLIWVCSLTWNTNEDWAIDHGYATPTDACLAWLKWLDFVEEG